MKHMSHLLPPHFQLAVQKALYQFDGFEPYLLRARKYAENDWQLKGFRLVQIGENDVDRAGGDPVHEQIEAYYKNKSGGVRNPPGI